MVRDIFLLMLVTVFIVIGCAKHPEQKSDDLKLLVSYMTGSFSSQAQAESDTNFFDIRLEMVPIWPDMKDGTWFYVEQAMAGYEDKPYRQRVYHVYAVDDTTFASDVYTIPDPLRFAGMWKQKNFFLPMTPDSLSFRDGCSIFLHKRGDAFSGGTINHDCPSDLHGASYATSEVKITAGQMYSWDRGYDGEGGQVWGAEAGGYIFKKSSGQVAEE